MKIHALNEEMLSKVYGPPGSLRRRKRDEKLLKLFESRASEHDTFGQVHYVPLKWVHDLNAKIKHLHGDIEAHFTEPNPDHPLGIWPFQGEWRIFWGLWNAWVIAHQSEWSRMGQEAETSFYGFRAQYNDFLRRFDELGGDTTATQSKGGLDPFDKENGKSVFTLGSGIGAGLVLGATALVGLAILVKK